MIAEKRVVTVKVSDWNKEDRSYATTKNTSQENYKVFH
jgi:hypothetical protein